MSNFTMYCNNCGGRMPLPAPSRIRANGRPVHRSESTCPSCGDVVFVDDFGDCRGIKKVRGFAGILASQKSEYRAVRREIRNQTNELYKRLSNLPWRMDRVERQTQSSEIRSEIRRITIANLSILR